MFGRFPKFTRCQTSAGEFDFFFRFLMENSCVSNSKDISVNFEAMITILKRMRVNCSTKKNKSLHHAHPCWLVTKKRRQCKPTRKKCESKNGMQIEYISYKYVLVVWKLLGRSHWASTSFLFEFRIFRHALKHKC